MKKIFIRLVASALLCVLTVCPLSGCGKAEDSGEIDITCTVFPIYDWVRSIVGDIQGVNVRLLVKNGTDVHSFQPSFEDMATVKGSEALIYIGGASDGWIGSSAASGAESLAISELHGITLYGASDVTDSHAHHGDEHSEEHSEEHSHQEEFDEHLWLSIGNAKIACKEIYALLCRLDEDNKEVYESNLSAYMSKLDTLETAMAAIGEKADKPLVFADRFPFVYLFSDHGIGCYAAFEGCSADTSADFETVVRLAERMNELELDHVLVTESSDGQLARSVISASERKQAEILVLNSMQSIGGSDMDSASYIDIMSANVAVLESIFK